MRVVITIGKTVNLTISYIITAMENKSGEVSFNFLVFRLMRLAL